MRTNKNTETVFLDILDTEEKIGKLNKFLKAADFMDPSQNKYQDLIDLIMPKLEELVALEEIILQTRAWKNLQVNEIKIISTREYIYARAPFYRKDKSAKEIRTLVGKESDWLNEKHPTIENLTRDTDFMSIAFNALSKAMDVAIINNVRKYENKFLKQTA